MREISKFQVIMVAFLCIFIFVIGAIYTNTKEMAESNAQSKIDSENARYNKEISSEEKITRTEDANIKNISKRIDELSGRVKNLETSNSPNKMNCKIHGIINGDGVEQLSEDTALEEARVNGKELVLTCSFQP